MSINKLNNSKISIKSLADKLIKEDNDGKITSNELSAFTVKNETEFVSLNIDTNTALQQMKNILGNKYVEDSTSAKSADTSNDSYSNLSIDELRSKIESISKDIKTYEGKKTALENEKTKLENEIKEKQNEYTKLEETISSENKNYKKIIETINSTTKNMEDFVASQQKKAAYDAMSEYNPEKDGEWSDYIQSYMSGKDFSSGYVSKIKGLTTKSEFVSNNLSVLGDKFQKLGSEIEKLNSSYKAVTEGISSITSKIDASTTELNSANTALNTLLATNFANQANGVTAGDFQSVTPPTNLEELKKLVSTEEYNLVESHNINLSEKLPNGKPKYIFARGKSDGKFHIYEMNSAGSRGTSLARKFGSSTTGGLKGADIVPRGNGYITKFDEKGKGECSGLDYYYLDNCNSVSSGSACYTTCSPLSLDIDGDGIKTSNNIIDFDIDGDGIVDKINDSADAVLVFDKDGDGISGSDGSETFGNNTDLDGDGVKDGYKDGFEALKALAKKEGMINGSDDNDLDSNDLKNLEEKYGLKIKSKGYNSEAKSLADVGISNIKLSKDDDTNLIDNFDGNGNQLMTQKGATFTINGEEREYADIWHKKLDNDNFFKTGTNNQASAISFDIDLSEDIANNTENKLKEISNSMADGALTKINTNKSLSRAKSQNIFSEIINRNSKSKTEEYEKYIEEQEEAKKEEEQEKKELEEKDKKRTESKDS